MEVCRKLRIMSVVTLFCVLAAIYYFRVSSTVLDVGDTATEAYLTTAVYGVMADIAKDENNEYSDFFSIERNSSGDVVFVSTNGLAVNLFTSEIVNRVCAELDSYVRSGVDVPAGVFTGVSYFSGYGKSVNVKLIRLPSAKCDLVSQFISAGINQTRHSVYVRVVPDVTLKAVGRSRQVSVEIDVMIYENIIVGKVPDTYLGVSVVH